MSLEGHSTFPEETKELSMRRTRSRPQPQAKPLVHDPGRSRSERHRYRSVRRDRKPFEEYSTSQDPLPSDTDYRLARYLQDVEPREIGELLVTKTVGIGRKRLRRCLAGHAARYRIATLQARPPEETQTPGFPLILPDGVAYCPRVGDYTTDAETVSSIRSEVLFDKLRPDSRVLSQRVYQDFAWEPELHKRAPELATFSDLSLDFCQLWNNFVDAFAQYVTSSQTFLACCLFVKFYRDVLWGPMRIHFALHLTVLAQENRLSSVDVCSLMSYLDGDPGVAGELDELLKFWPESLVQFMSESNSHQVPLSADVF